MTKQKLSNTYGVVTVFDQNQEVVTEVKTPSKFAHKKSLAALRTKYAGTVNRVESKRI
jgi:hypothetical protein